MAKDFYWKEYWFLLIAGILSGLITFLGKLFAENGLSLYEISLIPYAVACLIILPMVLFAKRMRLKKQHLLLYALYGFVVSLCTLTELGGVVLGAPVAVAVLLIYTQPLWTSIFGKFFLKEKFTKYRAVSVLLVILGVFILVNPLGEQFNVFGPGIIVSLLGGVFLSLWVIMGRVSGTRGVHPMATNFASGAFAIIFLLLFYPILLLFVNAPSLTAMNFNFPANIWILLIADAVFTIVICHWLIFHGEKKVESGDAGIILLLEPVSAAVLAAVFLGEAIGLNVILGGILIIAANYILIKKSAAKTARELA